MILIVKHYSPAERKGNEEEVCQVEDLSCEEEGVVVGRGVTEIGLCIDIAR